jgi:hypothetical protein
LDNFFCFYFFFVFVYSWSTLLWHRCYYPHRSRDSMSLVCRIFLTLSTHRGVTTFNRPKPTLSGVRFCHHRCEEKIARLQNAAQRISHRLLRYQGVLTIRLFKASALWADAFYKSICPSVSLSVCLFVCLFTFEVPFKRLIAPTFQSPNFFEIQNPWGKVMKRSGLRFEHFCSEVV